MDVDAYNCIYIHDYKYYMLSYIICIPLCTYKYNHTVPAPWVGKVAKCGYNMIQYDTIWYSMIQYDTVWYNLIQYDTIWYNMIQCLWPQAKGWKGMLRLAKAGEGRTEHGKGDDKCFRCMYSRREQVWQLGHCWLDHERTGCSGRCLVILDDLHANHLVSVQVQTLHLWRQSAWGMPKSSRVRSTNLSAGQLEKTRRNRDIQWSDTFQRLSIDLRYLSCSKCNLPICITAFDPWTKACLAATTVFVRIGNSWVNSNCLKIHRHIQQLSSTSEVNCSNVYIYIIIYMWSSLQSRKRPCSLQSPSCPFRRQPADWRSRRSEIFAAKKVWTPWWILMTERHTMSKRLLFKF